MSDQPMISIIIVNYNGKKHLENCLKSLSEIDYTNNEIILVDNNSSDDSIDYVEKNFPKIKISKLDKNYGFAEANNIGVKKAIGKYFLFLNNDTTVKPNFLSELIHVANQEKDIAICQSLLLKPNGEIDSSGDFVDYLGRAYNSRDKSTKVRPILSARGASMLVKRESFLDLGGFDKTFFVSFEDVDLGLRAWIWGYKVMLVPNSVVFHLGGQTVEKLNETIKFHGVKNTILLRMINFETTFVIRNFFVLFFAGIAKKFGFSIIDDPEEPPPKPPYKIIFRSIFWIIKNLGYITQRRKLINSRRVRTTKDLMMMGLITMPKKNN